MSKQTIKKIRDLKGREPITCITAYDTITAKIADDAGIEIVLVGDSLGTTALGFDTTIPVTMEIMKHHAAAVRRGVTNALLVADLPFLSYQTSMSDAISNAGALLRESGADAVKLEGGVIRADVIRTLVDNGIPVMAHIGLLPQSVKASGYAVKGRTEEAVDALRRDILAVAESGAFSVVLECVTGPVAEELTKISPIPTIGIGAGAGCDGQVLVIADLLGLTPGRVPSFVKQYADCGNIAGDAVRAYIADVKARAFPDEAHTSY